MGVYINMEMPKSCHCCLMCVQVSDGDIDWHWECCLLADKVARYATERISGCPLVPVPPHGRLVDADRILSEQMKRKYYHLPNGDTAIPVIDIEHAPTVIEAEEGEE